MADVLDRGTGRERFALVLMGAFAMVALALAALGLYGVLAYAVRQRSTEIGIRVALGATAAQVRALVFRQAAVVVGVGITAGLAGALVLGRWLEALAFGIAPSDASSPHGQRDRADRRGYCRRLAAGAAGSPRRAASGDAGKPLITPINASSLSTRTATIMLARRRMH